VQNLADHLFSLMRERVSSSPEFDFHHTPSPPHFVGADVHILASLLQKAIRRGDLANARRAGHQLLALDPSRLWRRLSVTALEDIGIGDSEAVAELVAIATLPELRRKLGGNSVTLDLALAHGCRAVKDRSADHLSSIAEREPIPDGRFDSLERASDNALAAVIASQCQHWSHCARAASILIRRYEEGSTASRVATLAPIFERFQELGAPERLVTACQTHAARQRDALALYVLIAWSFQAASGGLATIRCHDLPEPVLVDGIPEFAFDPHHTRIGRRAVELWRRCYLAPPPWTARQLGMALWNIEAAACDRTLDWPMGRDIRRRAYRADLLSKGVPEAEHAALYAWVIREHSALTCARTAAFRSATNP